MSSQPATMPDSLSGGSGVESDAPLPGLLLVSSMGQPLCVPLPLERGSLVLGRGDGTSAMPADPKMSRRHATLTYDGARFHITDHGGQNGTYLDGQRIDKSVGTAQLQVVRTGDSLFLFFADLRPLSKGGVQQEGDRIIGPSLRLVLAQAARASRLGNTLHITGETGSGKEGVARAFHAESPHGRGSFVAINCATIAPGVAERVLFGARRGAFSGAVTDTEGLVQSADGGTLFLDEIAELDLAVQAKLLRVLETCEVLPIGGLRPRQVNLQLCSASHRDLRTEISAGRFRDDLYYRINSPEAVVPPLRRRAEEIPWLIEQALRSIAPYLGAHSTFVEACLLRPWPGNVRELLSEVRAAAQSAVGLSARRLEPQHLSPRAGQPLERPAQSPAACAMMWHPPVPMVPAAKAPPRELPDRARVEAVLSQSSGNISAAARLLGLHRTQLKRLLEKLGMSADRSQHLDHPEQTLDDEGE